MKRTIQKRPSNKTTAESYEQIGAYWDSHDLVDDGGGDKTVQFTVRIQRRRLLGPHHASRRGLKGTLPGN